MGTLQRLSISCVQHDFLGWKRLFHVEGSIPFNFVRHVKLTRLENGFPGIKLSEISTYRRYSTAKVDE